MKKKLLTAGLLVLFLVALLPSAVMASSDTKIDIEVVLNPDGSALVTQTWDLTVNSGTEMYLPINTGEISISDLRVWDDTGNEYVNIGAWDENASFSEKSNRCGILTYSDRVELCWGITEYGHRSYTFSYVVGNIVGMYTDYDGFNFQFINTSFGYVPLDMTITISLADGKNMTSADTGIWAFGYEGSINFMPDGTVYACSSESLGSSNYANILMRFEKGYFESTRVYDYSFQKLYDKAMEGSDYKTSKSILEWIFTIVGVLFMVALGAVFIFAIVRSMINNRKIRKLKKEAGYYRDIPNGGSFELTAWITDFFSIGKNEEDLIGAIMLKLINDGCLKTITQKEVGFMGREKEVISLELVKEPSYSDFAASRLFHVLVNACGEDGILQEKELKRYVDRHPTSLRSVIDDTRQKGRGQFKQINNTQINKRYFEYKSSLNVDLLSDKGRDQIKQTQGFKNFLEDFSLIEERGVEETVLWQEYLVYATLLGIADKVLAQLKKLYPAYMQEFEMYERHMYYSHYYGHCMHSAMSAQERASGGGGSSSSGGGGGSSGGGSGGGSR